jgi:hypothetical protein
MPLKIPHNAQIKHSTQSYTKKDTLHAINTTHKKSKDPVTDRGGLWVWDVEDPTFSRPIGSQIDVMLSALHAGRALLPENVRYSVLLQAQDTERRRSLYKR